MSEYQVNIGPYQYKGFALGYGVNIGPYQGNSAPQIIDQTISESGVIGSMVVLFVVATGSPVPTYQWYHNDILIPDENSSTLNVIVNYNTDGRYRCVASNVVGSVSSDDIYVFVIGGCVKHLFEIPSGLIIEE